jgi:hypothetical protein
MVPDCSVSVGTVPAGLIRDAVAWKLVPPRFVATEVVSMIDGPIRPTPTVRAGVLELR